MKRIASYADIDVAFTRLKKGAVLRTSVEEVGLSEAYGRTLARDLFSPFSMPRQDMSHMDGFAIPSSETKSASRKRPSRFRLTGFVGPGQVIKKTMGLGEAVRITTGGYLPKGADAVVPQEEVRIAGDHVYVNRRIKPGENVDRAGLDIPQGQLLFRRGHRIRAQDVGLLASLGFTRVEVYKKPEVAILAVGSELTDDPSQVEQGKILNSHSHVVSRLVEAGGAKPLYLGIARDELHVIAQKLREARNRASMILTIGGSSVSEIDFVDEAASMLGRVNERVHGLKLQPGRVAGFVIAEGKPVIILPGLIQSTVNAYVFLAYPLIRILLGQDPRPYSMQTKAVLAKPIQFNRFVDFRKVVWVRLTEEDEQLTATPVMGESSRMSVIAGSDGYILLPEGTRHVDRGEEVNVRLVPGISYT